jgi:hypothetical protein
MGEVARIRFTPKQKPKAAKHCPTLPLQPLRIALRRAIAWPKKKPEDQAQQWQ